MKRLFPLFVLLLCVGVFGCAALNYSHVSPEAADFHPDSIAVLPVMVKGHQSAEGTVDNVISQALVSTGWFANVVDAMSLKDQISASEELSNDLSAYIQKLNTLGVSDTELARKVADRLSVDSLLLASVTTWGYGRVEGNKVGKAGIGLKLICGKNGTIMWKANHEEIEDYWVMKPHLGKLSSNVMECMLEEMPH